MKTGTSSSESSNGIEFAPITYPCATSKTIASISSSTPFFFPGDWSIGGGSSSSSPSRAVSYPLTFFNSSSSSSSSFSPPSTSSPFGTHARRNSEFTTCDFPTPLRPRNTHRSCITSSDRDDDGMRRTPRDAFAFAHFTNSFAHASKAFEVVAHRDDFTRKSIESCSSDDVTFFSPPDPSKKSL